MPGGPDRPALVFLHFFGGSARSWAGVLGELKSEYEAVALDVPGFGSAADAPGPYTLAAYADWVEQEVRARGIDRYLLVGHSMGGKIALALAARRPQGLQALVLLAPSPPTPEPIEESMRAKLIAGWGHYGPASETLARVTARPLQGALRERTIADMMAAGRGAWAAWLEQGSREDISAGMQCIETHATILSGDCDAAIPTDLVGREVADRLASADLVTVPGAGHLLPLEMPEFVARAIERCAEQHVDHQGSAAIREHAAAQHKLREGETNEVCKTGFRTAGCANDPPATARGGGGFRAGGSLLQQ